MTRTFTSATDEALIEMINSATDRLAVIAPGVTTPVAKAVAARMNDLPRLSLTVILDSDPEVYRMGYGDVEALAIIQKASNDAHFDLREQSGVRIGVVISDDRTMIYAPVSRNVEAGSTSADHPNAIVLGEDTATKLAIAAGTTPQDAPTPRPEAARSTPDMPAQEIGLAALSKETVDRMTKDLEETPPLPVDMTRQLNVFMTRVQYVEVKMEGFRISGRKVKLPEEFTGYASEELKTNVNGQIRSPMADIGVVEIDNPKGKKKLRVSQELLEKARREIEKKWTVLIPNKGRMILRRQRVRFESEIQNFRNLVFSYQQKAAEKIIHERTKFQKNFVDEFLPRWKEAPPIICAYYSESEMRERIEDMSGKIFDEMIQVNMPSFDIRYKDITIENLRDKKFMSDLKAAMTLKGVQDRELALLFQEGSAAAAKDAFPSQ